MTAGSSDDDTRGRRLIGNDGWRRRRRSEGQEGEGKGGGKTGRGRAGQQQHRAGFAPLDKRFWREDGAKARRQSQTTLLFYTSSRHSQAGTTELRRNGRRFLKRAVAIIVRGRAAMNEHHEGLG